MPSSRKALIITGPQGSGNHLFSKIFALHPSVVGWSDLNTKYWIGHDEEPFADLWLNPTLIRDISWPTNINIVTSISCPYISDGIECIPSYALFIDSMIQAGFDVQVAVIGRDTNILSHQQQRVRGKVTKQHLISALEALAKYNPTFISTELLYLYRQAYLKSLQTLISVPIDYENELIDEILINDPNTKYFTQIDSQPLDLLIHEASKPKHLRT